jgi:hypothetical protein
MLRALLAYPHVEEGMDEREEEQGGDFCEEELGGGRISSHATRADGKRAVQEGREADGGVGILIGEGRGGRRRWEGR